MRQRQTLQLGIRPSLVGVYDHDWEIEPYQSTTRTVDFLIGNQGEIRPVVTLSALNQPNLRIEFTESLDLEAELSRGLRALLQKVRIWFTQEDPTDPEVYVICTCGDASVSHMVYADQLEPYMDFLVDYDETEPGPEEHPAAYHAA